MPSLDELAQHPERAQSLSAPVRQSLLQRLVALNLLLVNVPLEETPANGNGDRLIDAAAAAQMLGIAPATLRKKQVPFRVKVVGRATRYSLAGIERYMRTKQGR
jgi:hypothetical protein